MPAIQTTTTLKTAPRTLRNEYIVFPGKGIPFIKFDGLKGSLTINGTATDMDIASKLIPLTTMVDEYLGTHERLTCNFLFKDFNSSTCKMLFKLFKKLQGHKRNNKIITITRLSASDINTRICFIVQVGSVDIDASIFAIFIAK